MSDNEQLVECKICGAPGIPSPECKTCEGRADVQTRQFTLSELRAMDHEERQRVTQGDRPSGAAPRIVDLPGTSQPGT